MCDDDIHVGLVYDPKVSRRTFGVLTAAAATRPLHAQEKPMIDAATALEWGLVAEVHAADEVAARVEAIAAFWLSNSTAAFGQAKRLIHAASEHSFAENLDDEARSIGARFDTDDAKARIAGFAAASSRSRSQS